MKYLGLQWVRAFALGLFTLTAQAADKADAALASPAVGPNIGVTGAAVSSTVMALALVVLVLFAGSFFLKRFRIVNGPAQLGVSVVGQIPMSVKEKLLVIQVGDEKILVGSGQGNMRTLHRWASPAEEPVASAEPVFARLLRGQNIAKSFASSTSTTSTSPAGADKQGANS